MTRLTPPEVADIVKGNKKSPIHEQALKMLNEMRCHLDGEYPQHLIDEARPNEALEIKVQRKKVWQPITKEKTSPVLTALGKIRRSPDWAIDYDYCEGYTSAAAKVRTGELPKDYLEYNFPGGYTSFTNWIFQVGLRANLTDANGLVLWMPKDKNLLTTDYLKPIPIVFYTDRILSYVVDDHCILRSYETITVSNGNGTTTEKELFMLVTDSQIEYYYIDIKGNVINVPDMTYVHGLGYMPIVGFRGLHRLTTGNYNLLESRIYPVVPRLNEMAREYSDQQANITLHLFPQRWEYQSETCKNCIDTVTGVSLGKIKDPANTKKFIKCPVCNGTTQKSNVGPYQKFIVRPAKTTMGETAAPIPPFGYDTTLNADVIKLVDERIEKHGYYALCALNMQFLDKTPVAQSGVAKEVDRDELNNFIYTVAEDVVAFMDDSHKIIIDYRYKVSIPDDKVRYELLPYIQVPQDYSILGSVYYADALKSAREAKMSPLVIAELETDYIKKAFYNDETIAELYELINDLDPMPGMSVDEKMAIYQNGGTTKELYIISCNITPFVKRAVEGYDNIHEYENLSREDKMKPLYEYANELMKPVETISTPPVE